MIPVVDTLPPHPAASKDTMTIAARTAAVLLFFMMLISPCASQRDAVIVLFFLDGHRWRSVPSESSSFAVANPQQ
jgi:CBS domain containing-hemolysin-like protein